ncbi:MAG: hypothetical protein NVSMB66_3920 [Candidatus Doudnabacteria bacterium]
MITDEKLEADKFYDKNIPRVISGVLILISIFSFVFFYKNGLGLAYNDARSHLDIARRVVEQLKPGLAQLGSVWLPLPHLLMVLTVGSDFMWHTGLAGALPSMIAYVVTASVIYLYLKRLGVERLGRIIGVMVFALNMNILYLQSTAMTELLLLATISLSFYYLLVWFQDNQNLALIKAAFWVMLSTLIRYDGWFLLLLAATLIFIYIWKRDKSLKHAEGYFILFSTLGGLGIFLWLLWNKLIFNSALYFAFGPYSAHAQQSQLEAAGNLSTKGHLFLSTKFYLYALVYNSGIIISILGLAGALLFLFSHRVSNKFRYSFLILLSPIVFNVLALYLGHSVLFIPRLSGTSWFNIRYGVMMIPSIAIFVGYLINRLKPYRIAMVALVVGALVFQFRVSDAVTVQDARSGASQKNVSEVSGWLNKNTKDKKGFILISVASHDAIVFSSGLPMSRFIHEGTGLYWDNAVKDPKHWARWIVMRTYSEDDATYRTIKDNPNFIGKYDLVQKYPFADVYALKDQYIDEVETKTVFYNQP